MGIRLQNKTWENSHYTIEPNLDFYLKSVSLYLFSRIMIIKGFLGFREKLTLFALEGNETNTSMGDVKFPWVRHQIDLFLCQRKSWSERSLVRPPAHSQTDCEVGLGCAGLNPVVSWKPPRLETTQPLWAPFQCVSVLGVGGNFSLYAVWTSLCCCISPSRHVVLWRALLWLLGSSPHHGHWNCCLVPLRLSPLPSEPALVPQPLLTGLVLQATNILVALGWTPVDDCLPSIGLGQTELSIPHVI